MVNPGTKALQLLHQIGWSRPGDLTMEDIVFSLNGILKFQPLSGSEGRILIKGDNAIITVNSSISYEPRKNWVIAHEIGHFCLHKDVVPLFSDTDKTLSDWFQKGPQEQQANDFASELLMPSPLFKQKVAGKKLDISLIHDIANYFNVSLTATFLKYRFLGDFPVMIIFIENGLIKWKQYTQGFPFEYIEYDSKVPVYTVAGDLFYNKTKEEAPEKVDAIEWFPDDFSIKTRKTWQLWEQCYRVSDTGIVSCLWTF
ncbi:ImmA/IrrE family metallo-endopeptidase [Mucilaginibacter agri]|uniref:ImmA/IrrE family metallo-endopeptidase n=1 Tax=Mucilaginibacter agri TaxID=2695265 RepID=A0A965ZJU0_9SPHI|nr:ImmA/IrrE family metallo-endopeptidase [Mucilaginibacter agri]NCD70956.1 ImmA/IrrE family metallo-endopeptidase [Mucilaginibacter agri]